MRTDDEGGVFAGENPLRLIRLVESRSKIKNDKAEAALQEKQEPFNWTS